MNAREDGGCKGKREGGSAGERELIEGLGPNRHSAQHSTVSRLAGSLPLYVSFDRFCLHVRTLLSLEPLVLVPVSTGIACRRLFVGLPAIPPTGSSVSL